MAVSVDTLINNVASTLLDTSHRSWTRADLLSYLNKAQRTICGDYKLDAYTKLAYIPLVDGTNQSLPEDGQAVAVMDITQNQGTKLRITLVDQELLDESNRFWQAATHETDVQHWCADPRSPRRFNVTPPNDGDGSVLTLYGAIPDELTGSSGEVIQLNDSLQYPLECLMLAYAYAKNSKKQDFSKTQYYTNECRLALGLKSQGQVAVAPKVAVSEGMK